MVSTAAMRKILLLAAVFSCAIVVLGCPKKKKDDIVDAAADGAVEPEVPAVVADAATPPAAVTAKNSADVARFAAETALAREDAKLGQPSQARTSPKTGTVIATLK